MTDIPHYSDHCAPCRPVKMEPLADRILRSPIPAGHRVIDHYDPRVIHHIRRCEEAASQQGNSEGFEISFASRPVTRKIEGPHWQRRLTLNKESPAVIRAAQRQVRGKSRGLYPWSAMQGVQHLPFKSSDSAVVRIAG